jgi:hypothetical protein
MQQPVHTRYKHYLIALLMMVSLLTARTATAQVNPTDSIPNDPAALSVYTVQNMNFGAFTSNGAGGTVSVSTNGARTTTGSIVPLNMSQFFYQAIFDVSAPQGSIISILYGPDATLTGNNGGSMSMRITGSNPASPFITTVLQPLRTQVSISGVLTVGSLAANPPGAYSGSFYVTFAYE